MQKVIPFIRKSMHICREAFLGRSGDFQIKSVLKGKNGDGTYEVSKEVVFR
jgi:hypothetical protein